MLWLFSFLLDRPTTEKPVVKNPPFKVSTDHGLEIVLVFEVLLRNLSQEFNRFSIDFLLYYDQEKSGKMCMAMVCLL